MRSPSTTAAASRAASELKRARCVVTGLFLAGAILGVYTLASWVPSSSMRGFQRQLAPRLTHGHGDSHAGLLSDAQALLSGEPLGDAHGHGDAHSHGHGAGDVDASAPVAAAGGALGADTSLSPSLSRALSSSVLSHLVPSRVVRRTFRDPATGADVTEDAAYFDVPDGQGEALARAIVGQQSAAAATGDGSSAVDEVVVRRSSGGTGGGAASGDTVAAAGVGESVVVGGGAGGEVGGSLGAGAGVGAIAISSKDTAAPAAPVAAAPAPGVAPAAVVPLVAGTPPSTWLPLEIPSRPTQWLPAERPVPGERDAAPASHAFLESTAASDAPPSERPGLSPLEREELSHRLVIAVAMGVHSGTHRVAPPGDRAGVEGTPIVKVLLSTFLPTAQPHHVYRFYLAYDHGDPVYDDAANRAAIAAVFAERFAAEDAARWHPPGSSPQLLDGSRLVYSLHWVHCDYSGKPSWAHSDAAVAAVREGADYVYRSNDDSEFPRIGDWADRFIADLRSRSPVPNLGVTGPTCNEGATWILTHDFTHATHTRIFGTQYPRALPNWSSDDWVTFVYAAFGLQTKLAEAIVGHTFVLGTRYTPDQRHTRLAALNAELASGAALLAAWIKEHRGVVLPYKMEIRDCC